MFKFKKPDPPCEPPCVRRLSPTTWADDLAGVASDCLAEFDARSLRRILSAPAAKVVGAFGKSDDLVGFAVAQPAGRSLYLRQVAVLPGHRRQGHGRRMLERLEGEASRHYASGNAAVPEAKLAAQLFLKACGWECFAVQTVDQDTDHYLFRKPWLAAVAE